MTFLNYYMIKPKSIKYRFAKYSRLLALGVAMTAPLKSYE